MEVEAVLGAISEARVPYPRHEILTAFVKRAADPERAAQHLRARCGGPDGSLARTPLEGFLADWEELVGLFERSGPEKPLPDGWVADTIRTREANSCRLTGRQGSWRDPLAVYPILTLTDDSLERLGNLPRPLEEILCAFLGDDVAAWACAGCKLESPLAGHWLVLKSVAETFAQGFWKVEPMEGYPSKLVVATQGPCGGPEPPVVDQFDNKHGILIFDRHPDIESPDSRALEVTARFAEPIRFRSTGQHVPLRPPPLLTRLALSLSSLLRTAGSPIFRALWLLWIRSPEPWRFRAYSTLARVGRALYGGSASRYVQRLPFGMYLKTHTSVTADAARNELGALQLIRGASRLAVPEPLDLVSNERRSYMITRRMPGVTASSVFVNLSDEQLSLLAQDLGEYLSQLRRIPKPPGLEAAAISNSAGGGCLHCRIDEAHGENFKSHGPFPDEAAFHDYLPTRRPPAPEEVQRTGHNIRLSHGDLALRNIIIDRWGRLVGLVDWEHSGWYPEYWEFTAFHWTIPQRRWKTACSQMIPDAQNFEHELAVERRLWAYL